MEQSNKYEWGEGVYTLLSWFKKDKVKNARVLVAGCGALGNEVVKNLALFGVGHIYVVDFDRIEITNLTRSVLFREGDAFSNSYKAEVVAKRAMEINPQIKVIPFVGNLASEVGLGIYRMVDVVIGCLDSRMARYLLNRMSFRAGKTWIDGGIENLTGAVTVYTPGVNCYECGLSREEFQHLMLRTGCADVVRLQTQAGRVATTPVSASIVGAMQAQEAMKVIHTEPGEKAPFKTLSGKIWRFEGMSCSFNSFKYAPWKNDCPAHDEWEPITPASSLSAKMTVADALAALRDLLHTDKVEINMCNTKFIDRIASDKPEREFVIRIPESKLDDYLAQDPVLHNLSQYTVFHKKFYENIDDTFPYPEMTLQEIGIPLFDVIPVSTPDQLYYVELSADKQLFE